MNTVTSIRRVLPLALCALAFSTTRAADSDSAANRTYDVTRTIKVGGIGGWDYLTVDGPHKLLFVPRSTHTMVLDSTSGYVVADIKGQGRNHGVALAANAARGFISDGADGSVVVFSLDSYAVLGRVKVAADADGIVYDAYSDKVLVVCGDSGVVVPISPEVDPVNGLADPPVELGGKPEYLTVDGKGSAFINLVDKNEVAVLDTKHMKVVNRWSTAPGGSPVGMSIDREGRRLFVGCRKPQVLVVMDADSGSVLASLPIGAGVDATHFDHGDAFASCRDGTLAVARQTSPGRFEIVQTVKTAPGARTMGVDHYTHTLYLPTAEFLPADPAGGRPTAKPDTFKIVVVAPMGGT
jgi:DNA-binding beta-propeller fold protein YncE